MSCSLENPPHGRVAAGFRESRAPEGGTPRKAGKWPPDIRMYARSVDDPATPTTGAHDGGRTGDASGSERR
eukprot:3130145-Alexandrium_andersonii.AAC.1